MPRDPCSVVLAALKTPEEAQDVVTACAGLSTTSNASQLLPFQGPAVAALQTERVPDTLYDSAAANIQLMPFACGISCTFAPVFARAADTKSNLPVPGGGLPAESLLLSQNAGRPIQAR